MSEHSLACEVASKNFLFFFRWNYGGLTQASEREDEAGYTEFGDEDSGGQLTNQNPLF